jgi:hypothetical protein
VIASNDLSKFHVDSRLQSLGITTLKIQARDAKGSGPRLGIVIPSTMTCCNHPLGSVAWENSCDHRSACACLKYILVPSRLTPQSQRLMIPTIPVDVLLPTSPLQGSDWRLSSLPPTLRI